MTAFKAIPGNGRVHGYRAALRNGQQVEVVRHYPGEWSAVVRTPGLPDLWLTGADPVPCSEARSAATRHITWANRS